jgi:hypothetical protein
MILFLWSGRSIMLPPDISDTQDAVAPAIAPDALVTLICSHSGHVTLEDLRAAGFTDALIDAWEHQAVLTGDPSGGYQLASPDVYVDWLIQALWELPAGIIGHLTALEYHGLSVAWLRQVDVGVRRPPPPTVPARVRPFPVPEALWDFGVEHVIPALPGTITIPMYTPAVALAQVLADLSVDLESASDASARYLSERGMDVALQEAAACYGVTEGLQRLVRASA